MTELATREGVVQAVASLEPDVVVLDVRMPVVDVVEATRPLRESEDAPPVLVLTTSRARRSWWARYARVGLASSWTATRRTVLTRRERQVLVLIDEGLSNTEVAGALTRGGHHRDPGRPDLRQAGAAGPRR